MTRYTSISKRQLFLYDVVECGADHRHRRCRYNYIIISLYRYIIIIISLYHISGIPHDLYVFVI